MGHPNPSAEAVNKILCFSYSNPSLGEAAIYTGIFAGVSRQRTSWRAQATPREAQNLDYLAFRREARLPSDLSPELLHTRSMNT